MPAKWIECSFEGCGRPAAAKTLCLAHYQQTRQRPNGQLTPLGPMSRAPKECAFEGCGHPAMAKGYCRYHYYQRKNGGKLTPRKIERSSARKCSFPGCDRPHYAKGYCNAHYNQRNLGVELKPVGSYKMRGSPKILETPPSSAKKGESPRI